MPVTLPDSSSQRMPFQEEGQVADDWAREVVVHDSRRFSGSAVIPFLNSSRDRSSGSEAEQVRVMKKVKKTRSRTQLGEEFIGVNVDGETNTKTTETHTAETAPPPP